MTPFANGMQSRYPSSLERAIREIVRRDEENDGIAVRGRKKASRNSKAHSKARTPVAKIAQAMKRAEGALRRGNSQYWRRPRSVPIRRRSQPSLDQRFSVMA
jgi:hypothetical protein